MRQIAFTLCSVLLALLVTACGDGAESAVPDSAPSENESASEAPAPAEDSSRGETILQQEEENVYRGRVTEIYEDSILVRQLHGYDYGQSSILFYIDDDTELSDSGIMLQEDAFVEVKWDGALTRSIPPQATAESVLVLSPQSDGIIVNGIIDSVSQTDGVTYRITVAQLDGSYTGAEEDEEIDHSRDNQVVLLVTVEALEHLTREDLEVGAEISAVTRGMAALSMPPQYPVHALLPYNAGQAD